MTLVDKLKLSIKNGNNVGAKKLASILLKEEHKAAWDVYETELCSDCNVLAGEDNGCVTCDGVGTVEALAEYTPLKVTDEMVLAKLSEYGYMPKEKVEAMKYLADTDWMVTRYAETGRVIDDEVKAKREEARSIL